MAGFSAIWAAIKTAYKTHVWLKWASIGAAVAVAGGTTVAVVDNATPGGIFHQHTYTQVVTAPTCTEKGYITHTCTVCEDSYIDTYVDELGHAFIDYISNGDATCTADGTKTAICNRTGCTTPDTKTDVGSMLPHTFDKEVAESKYFASEATCTSKATYYYSCVCGKKGETTFEYGNFAPHPAENTWTYDETHHWHETTCACEEMVDYAEHTTDSSGWCTVCNQSISPTEGILYDLSADGTYAEVIGYEGTATRVKIADTYQGKPVTSIYNSAFKRTSITEVIIPDSVISIGDWAFYECSRLTIITIGDSVSSIGDLAFRDCSRLTSVTIPDSVTSIGDSAFYNCSSLTSVTIPNSVTSIGDATFYGCSSLTSVTIPDSVSSIGSSAFNYCNKLTFATYGNANYLGNENNPYVALIEVSTTNYSFYTIHENTKVIAKRAFEDCGRMTSVTIPDSVTSIGDYAFSGCSSLTSVTFKNPNGWRCYSYSVMSISSTSLSDPVTAATYLKSTYDDYYWNRS